MNQTMEGIIRIFCAYGMEYKDNEVYTHDLVTLLPDIKLAYSTRQNSSTEKTPSLIEKVLSPLFPVDHLKNNLLEFKHTEKDFYFMWKKACDTAERCISEAKEYNHQRYDKTHKEPDLREWDQVLVSICQPVTQNQSTSMTAKYHKTNGIVKIPLRNGAEPNQLKRYQKKEETHPFPNIQLP
ncbi:hypothetical protein O181_014608 [Austropuccinia psidii MF-1]|uniref:Uncharacterized protein n=1 Tax=Austropuccinia psidii MF-1 TaxID=1389203 RepID=A0A9Q3GP68_9BASI|nr:hypothetical protein [Austropuccinia psidii MF-1]